MEADGGVRLAVAAASAALGRPLSDAVQLAGGSASSLVLRCGDGACGSVIVKRYPPTDEGAGSFTAEAAGLVLARETGLAPELLATDQELLVVVMTDLGDGATLADLLLADGSADAGGGRGADAGAGGSGAGGGGARAGSADDASAAVLAWARACGELSAATLSRIGELAGLRDQFSAGRELRPFPAQLSPNILAAPEQAAALGVQPPDGLDAELAEVARAVQPDRFGVFSPGDLCPDNNLVTAGGVRLLDFESAGIYSVFLDAAYIRMPFSTCWCVFRLPADLSKDAEATYRQQVSAVLPPLADDQVWAAGLRRGVAAWSMNSMHWLLQAALRADRPLDEQRTSPTTRQLMRYRWEVLAAELEPSGELPALAELARSLLAATVSWNVPELPVYPVFRDR